MNDFPFKPAPNAAPARWVVDGLRSFGGRVSSVVPAGFEAYARVYHPAWRVTHTTRTALRWSEVAKTGRIPHKQMRWSHIRGETARYEDIDHTNPKPEDVWLEDPHDPHMGSLPLEAARPLWQLLSHHTNTPERCLFGIWEGFGCSGPEARRAPVFETPERRWHLFQAPVEAAEKNFCADGGDPSRTVKVPILVFSWKNPFSAKAKTAETNDAPHEPPTFHQSANLWWPEDRAWCVGTEIDLMTTYVGGTREAVTAILESGLEAHQVKPSDGVS